MGYENEDDFIVGLRNQFAIFGWAANFYLKFLISLPAPSRTKLKNVQVIKD